MSASAAVAVILMKEKQIVAAFRAAGATSPGTARTPSSIDVDQRVAFHKLCRGAVLRETEPGHYFLDEPTWEAARSRRQRMALVMLVAVLALAVWALVRR